MCSHHCSELESGAIMQFLHQERDVNLFVLDTFLDGAHPLRRRICIHGCVGENSLRVAEFWTGKLCNKGKTWRSQVQIQNAPTLVVGSSRSTTVQPTTNKHVSIVCNFLQKSLCSFFACFLFLLLQAASMPTGISQKRFVWHQNSCDWAIFAQVLLSPFTGSFLWCLHFVNLSAGWLVCTSSTWDCTCLLKNCHRWLLLHQRTNNIGER